MAYGESAFTKVNAILDLIYPEYERYSKYPGTPSPNGYKATQSDTGDVYLIIGSSRKFLCSRKDALKKAEKIQKGEDPKEEKSDAAWGSVAPSQLPIDYFDRD